MISKDNSDHRGTWNTYLCKNTLKDPVENEKRNREKKKNIQMGNKIGGKSHKMTGWKKEKSQNVKG